MAPEIAPDLQAALLKIAHDPLATLIGLELLGVSPGHSRVALTLADRHLNSLGGVHGGTIFALADQAFALAANSHGTTSVAINVSVSFVASAGAGERLIAEATEQHLGGRTGLYQMEVRTEAGKLVASCQGMVYRLREQLLQRHSAPLADYSRPPTPATKGPAAPES